MTTWNAGRRREQFRANGTAEGSVECAEGGSVGLGKVGGVGDFGVQEVLYAVGHHRLSKETQRETEKAARTNAER